MLEALYEAVPGKQEAESVMDFIGLYISDDEAEDLFFKAVRDSRLAGFKEGVRAANDLYAETRA
jgi:hypothetical protein